MRSTLFAAVLAALACGTAQADGQFIPLTTPSAQATKFSENGDYLVASIFSAGGMRWSRATQTEELISGMYALNGINNAGTVAGAAPDGDMDNGDMGGMDTGALAGMSGTEFDRMFLTMMIEHHRGAVEMATAESAEGQNADAIALAESIRDSQNAEIAEMQQLLTELDG